MAPAWSSATSAITASTVDRPLDEPKRPARNRRDQRDLVSLGQGAPALGVFPVDRVEEAARLLIKPQSRPDILDRSPLGQLDLTLTSARALAQSGEELDRDAHGGSVD